MGLVQFRESKVLHANTVGLVIYVIYVKLQGQCLTADFLRSCHIFKVSIADQSFQHNL